MPVDRPPERFAVYHTAWFGTRVVLRTDDSEEAIKTAREHADGGGFCEVLDHETANTTVVYGDEQENQ